MKALHRQDEQHRDTSHSFIRGTESSVLSCAAPRVSFRRKEDPYSLTLWVIAPPNYSPKWKNIVRVEVVTSVNMMTCSIVERQRRFGGILCLNLQFRNNLLSLKMIAVDSSAMKRSDPQERYQRFGVICCLHIQGERDFFAPKLEIEGFASAKRCNMVKIYRCFGGI